MPLKTVHVWCDETIRPGRPAFRVNMEPVQGEYIQLNRSIIATTPLKYNKNEYWQEYWSDTQGHESCRLLHWNTTKANTDNNIGAIHKDMTTIQ
jgi:hypothetical protein